MKLSFSQEWLRRKIPKDPEADPEAGLIVTDPRSKPKDIAVRSYEKNLATVGDRTQVQLRVALGVLVRQLRLRDRLTLAQLAERADVAEEELRKIEHDPHYTARPRIISQLSKYFKVSLATLSQLSGATQAVDRKLYNASVLYAAHSDDNARLTDEERQALDAFVFMLNERAKHKP